MSLERNYYTDRFLDEDFESAIFSKENKIKSKYSENELLELYFDNALKINSALCKFKPNRHQKKYIRNHKRTMLEYLDRCILEDLTNLSYRDKLEFKVKYVDEIASNISFLGFKIKDYVPFFIGAALVVDILLMIFGLSKYYYYIPLVTILVVYRQIKGMRKAKKEGKWLR